MNTVLFGIYGLFCFYFGFMTCAILSNRGDEDGEEM